MNDQRFGCSHLVMNEHSKFRTHKQMNDRTNTIDTRTKQIYLYFNAHHTTPQFTILFCSFSMFDLYVRCSVYYYQYRSLPWTCEKSRKEADRERERENVVECHIQYCHCHVYLFYSFSTAVYQEEKKPNNK